MYESKTLFSNYLIFGILCVLLNACGSNGAGETIESELGNVDPIESENVNLIDNTSWQLESVQLNDGSTITVAQEDPNFFFGLDFTGDSTTVISDGVVIGPIDCNGFSANYLFNDSVLTLDNILITDAECEDVSVTGGIVFRALFMAPLMVDINPDTLILTSVVNESLIYIPLDN